jgi:hypothetical protein
LPRSRALIVLAVALALSGAASAGMSATAYAYTPGPPGPITIDPVVQVSTASGGGEVLYVTADDSASALTSMTVHLLNSASDQQVLKLNMNPPTGGAPVGQSTWSSPLISTSNLPQLGVYNVAVDAADGAGNSVSYQPAGTFAFQDSPSIAPNAANLVISYSNRTPTISGTVTVLPPGATSPQPYDGPVIIADSVLGPVPLKLTSNGSYSYTFDHPVPGEIFSVEVPATSSVAAASTAGAEFSAQTDPVAMSAGLSSGTVSYGHKVTVSGTVSYEPGNGYVPLAGQAVQIYDSPGAPSPVATAVTGANGHFTATLPKEAESVHWVVQAGGPTVSPYLGAASVTLPMTVNLPTAVSGFGVALSVFGQLSYRGCLAMAAGVPGNVPAARSGVAIQYAADPNGPWRTLSTVPTSHDSAQCGNGRAFSGTVSARLNYAYYRASYAGTNVAGTGYLAAASGRVLAWKYDDRITGFSVSPHTVASGGKLTVNGQLQYYSGKWRDYAGQTVYIILLGAHCPHWCYIAAPRTDSNGRFSATFVDPESATWSAEFLGGSAHFAALATLVYVTVR